MNSFIRYIQQVRAELTKVTWPSNKEAIMYTALVVGVSAVIALFVAAVDFGIINAISTITK